MNLSKLLSICCLLTLAASCSTPEQPKKVNVIYILADDLGYGELGAYGQQVIQTPNIDRLAAEGMRFTQHYSGSPVCAPSRYMLLTGFHPGHAYIRGNDEWAERGKVWDYAAAIEDSTLEGQRPIPAETFTLGELFQSQGYKTALVGKWGLGAPGTEGDPSRQGFDLFYGYNCQRQAHNLFPRHVWKNEEKVWLDNEIVAPGTQLDSLADPNSFESYTLFQQKEYGPKVMHDQALDFIDQNKDNPFFLYYASPLPHLPLQAPPEYVEKYRAIIGEEEPYPGGRGYFPNQYPRATYAAMINYLDDQVGELIEKLKANELYENTLIIFSSDNGPTYDVGGVDPHRFASAGPFNTGYGWGKGFTHEGGIRVPMIASWPGHIAPGTESDHISAFWDVFPTMASLLGYDQPFDTDGISFLPELIGEPQQAHDYLYWEFPSYGGQQAVRKGSWKAIRKDIQKDSLTIALYNLDDDPKEENNIADLHPDVVKEMEQIMRESHTPSDLPKFIMTALGDQ